MNDLSKMWLMHPLFKSRLNNHWHGHPIKFDTTCYHGVNQKVLPVLPTETLLHIWLSTEYCGFRPSCTAVDTGDTRGLMMSK